jgi:hypothetical protein
MGGHPVVSSAAVPDKRRAELTTAKIRRGALLVPKSHRRKIGAGDGTACNGCGEIITATEKMHSARVDGVVDLRFHDSCYTAWTIFRSQ